MVKIFGAKHNSKSSSDAYVGWGFIAGFIIAIFMVIIVNISTIKDQVFFDNGYDIDAIVVDYGWFHDTGENGKYLLQIEFIDIDGNNYCKVFNYFRYDTTGSAEAQIGKTIPIKTNGHGKFLQGIERPYIPAFVYILFAAFSVFGIIGITFVIKYQWLIAEYKVLKKGYYGSFNVLEFEKKKAKDKYYRLKIEVDTETGKRVMYTAARFEEGEAALCFAFPKNSKFYRAKYKINKVIIVEDFDYLSESIKNEKKTVYFENGKMVINIDYESPEYLNFRNLKDNKINDELKIKEQLTPSIRKKYGIGGKFTIPQHETVIGTKNIQLYVKSSINKLSDKYIGKKMKIFHNPTIGNLTCVEMSLMKNINEEIGDPLSERDALDLLSKYGNWFELDGIITKIFSSECVILCEIKVPIFGI